MFPSTKSNFGNTQFKQSIVMKYFALPMCILVLCISTAAQPALLTNQLDALMQDYSREKHFSGVVMVSKAGKLIYEKTVGYADYEKKIPIQRNTNFNIASAGKTFTAVLVMQLVQEGKLKLDDPINKYLGNYAIKNGDIITIRQLLSHTSGIGNYMNHAKFPEVMHSLLSLDDVMKLVTDMPPTLQFPGERFDYSNSGFITLGKLVEQVTGKDYTTNLSERIFKPLGLTNSYIHYPATFTAPAEAVPYYVYSSKTYVNGVKDEYPAFSDGGMQSNAPDLLQFANGLLNYKIVNSTLADTMWSGVTTISKISKYGLGWVEKKDVTGRKIVSHSGGGHGFSADLKIAVDDQYVVVVLANLRFYAPELSDNILRLIYTGNYKRPEIALESHLFSTVEEQGFDYMKEHYKSILRLRGLEKTPDVEVYVRLMDIFFAIDKTDEAFAVSEMAKEEFPMEAIPYNAIGQWYLDKGNKEEAVNYFKKALLINADDPYAKMRLEQLKE